MNPVKIHAYYIYAHHPQYFAVLQETARFLGVPLEGPLKGNGHPFQWETVIELFLEDHCASETPLQMLTLDTKKKYSNLRLFSELLEETLDRHEAISEQQKGFWRYQIKKGLL